MASTILFSPPMPPMLMDVARAMVPPGFDLLAADRRAPDFLRALPEAEYWMGFARAGLDREFFATARRLRLVQLISAGYDTIDVEAARRAGVPIANNGGANAISVAEHTLMLMLAVLKRMVWCHTNVVAGKWRVGGFDERILYELSGKTVGIIGLGRIGKKVARRVQGFDARVQYYDIVRLTEDQEDALGVRFVLLDELLRTSDVVTVHVPLNDVTRGLMSTREFALMKPGAIFVNTCRGPVVDEAALEKALTSKHLGGAGLDVMVDEPPQPGHPLFGLENVVITPHMAGPTWENWPRAFRNGFDNILRVAAGRPPLWVVAELAR
ncbi:MAG TPA: 2-hydroxyacid dehydrogenase [Methylomirabilota bacterium]|nr:2-hydroxyacid dehydrogenase [Methylomirabilota bacterium]